MIRKKLPYDTMLAIALMMSVLRVDWTDYMRDHLFVAHPRLQDSILGPSVGLTETQFHNLYNAAGVDLGQVHSKNVIRDSFYYNRSVFRELDSLYHGLPSVTNRSRVELQTFLLETLDSGSGHRTSNGNAVAHPQPQNPTQLNLNGDQPIHDSDSDEGFEEMETEVEGAVGQSPLSVSPMPSDDHELSLEDMDLIESLWRQDIDMGVCPDTYPYKSAIKPGFNDDLKKNINPWEYSIDGETGEFVPGPLPDDGVQTAVQPQVPQQPQQPQMDPQDTSLSLEDCLQLLEDEYSPDTAQSDLPPILTHQEAEQRWQDLATIPELQGSIPELLPNATTLNSSQGGYAAPQQHYMQAMTNGSSGLAPEVSDLSQSQRLNDVFAMNATTNGMVSLQNASQAHQQPLLMQNDTFGNFANLNSPSHSSNASVASNDNNMTDFLMQALPQQMNQVNASSAYSPGNMTDNSSSLLMELLNSPSAAHPLNPLDLDFDDQMQDVLAALDGDSLEDEDSDDSIFDESEGATGYSSSSSEQDVFKGATGGYGVLRGHERQFGSDSSSNSYSSQPPKMENIKHNHSYAAPSQSQMQNGNGAQNSSCNGTNNNPFKSSRDEKRAKSLKLPISVDKIINMPVDAFNDAIKKYELSDAQLQLIRDIRRRGKNKVAAQNCRKRKIDAINMVESTVGELRMERDKLVKERDSIDKEVSEMQQRYAELCEEVFSSIQDEHGSPVDPNDYTLQQMPDGTVFLVPRNGKWSSHRDRDEQSM